MMMTPQQPDDIEATDQQQQGCNTSRTTTDGTTSKSNRSPKSKKHVVSTWNALGVGFFLLLVGVVIAVILQSTLADGESNSSNKNQKSVLGSSTSSSTLVQDQDPSDAPSSAPTASMIPSSVPTSAPSDMPSLAPSSLPSKEPSSTPTSTPSTMPSHAPTTTPTHAPTMTIPEPLYVPVNPVPDKPPPGYFNYDVNDNQYGPHRWSHVDTSQHALREFGYNGFGVWRGHFVSNQIRDPTRNRCGAAARKQSPKNLVQAAGGRESGECVATHEIRTKCGSLPLSSSSTEPSSIINSDQQYQRLILPHKLSLVMNRRPCLQMDRDECHRGAHPPLADYPRYSSKITSFSDMLNLDIKVPGEHTLEGIAFDAEIQMLHTHIDDQRVSSIGIPIRARSSTSTNSSHNQEFQELLDEFQLVYDQNADACAQFFSRRQQRTAANDTGEMDDDNAVVDDLFVDVGDIDDSKQNNSTVASSTISSTRPKSRPPRPKKFNPYSKSFMPGIFFYRYDGSMTEPPCFPLTWFVMMEPMIISFEQLNQIKHLLFTNMAPKNGKGNECQKTSVHNANQQVTRPIQPLGEDRGIQKCAPGSFKTDEEKGRGDGNMC